MLDLSLYIRSKAIKSVKNVLNFGRRKSCGERQALFASSRESSLESNTEQSEQDDEEEKEEETQSEYISEQKLHERYNQSELLSKCVTLPSGRKACYPICQKMKTIAPEKSSQRKGKKLFNQGKFVLRVKALIYSLSVLLAWTPTWQPRTSKYAWRSLRPGSWRGLIWTQWSVCRYIWS